MALLDSLEVDRFLTWGVSGGGPHTLACAALLPDRVIAAATIASAAPYDAEGLDFLAGMGQDNLDEFDAALAGEDELRPYLEKELDEIRESTPEGLKQVLDSLLPPVDKAALTGARAEFVHASSLHGLSNGVDGWLDDDVAFTRPWGFDVASIRVPLQLLQGEQDLMVPFAHGQWLADQIRGVEAVLPPDEGHLSLAARFARRARLAARARLSTSGRRHVSVRAVAGRGASAAARIATLLIREHTRERPSLQPWVDEEVVVHDEQATDETTSDPISRLERDLTDSREQLRATGEVLSTLGRSMSDPEAVLGTIVRSARELCRADVAQIYLLQGGRFELASASGSSEEYSRWIEEHPVYLDRGSLLGRVALDRTTQQIPDVLADPEYGRPDNQRIGGFRTIVSAPHAARGRGRRRALSCGGRGDAVQRTGVELFTTFAAQAAVAISTCTWWRAGQAHRAMRARSSSSRRWARSARRSARASTSTRCCRRSSRHAVQLTGTDGGSMMEYDEEPALFRVRFALRHQPRTCSGSCRRPADRAGRHTGRSGRSRRPADRRPRT